MLREKRKRFYSTWMDGRPVVVDVAAGIVHFDAVADRAGLKTDVILVKEQKNIHEQPGPDPYLHKSTDFVLQSQRPLTPEEEMKRSEKLLEGFRFPSAELTIGDISILEENKRKHRVRDGKRFLRNLKEGLSVGDLTEKEDEGKGLDELFSGRPMIKPALAESAQIEGQRVARRQKEIDQAARVRSMLLGGRDEALEKYLDKYVRGKPEEEPK